ncbi:type II secretion system F family protein [Arcanobacterium phocisimile]|uniref:Type II secretion system F family protein n=1 Tax=Arcanobacterium phocisimile TaxID=1302235 RepID=A0ABX7IEX3_9ACTO|nr:type II secretion system F family protein [Arcanobacterium phocisimile]QRV01686.1 type II secretion system F family protein [Arcanobacterium phocisimile]
MGFLAGAVVGLGVLLIHRAWGNPKPVKIPGEFYPLVGSALAGTLVGLAVTGSSVVAVCGAVLGGAIHYVLRQAHTKRQLRAQHEAWPDVLDDVVASLRAGLSVSQSLAKVGERGPEMMRGPFARCAQATRAHGRVDLALDQLKEEFNDALADRVLEAMRVSHELGGRDLAGMLSRLASVVREDNRARGELLARQSWTVNGARMAAAAPWALLAMFATRPGTIEAFSSPGGALVLSFGAVVTVIAYALMIKLGELTPDSRIFTRTRRTVSAGTRPATEVGSQ